MKKKEEESRYAIGSPDNTERLRRQNRILEGINRILREAITCDTEKELAGICLSVAEHLTDSTIGFIGELRANGTQYDVTVSNPPPEECLIDDTTEHHTSTFNPNGLYGSVVKDGTSLLTNDPAGHPCSRGLPEGHPSLTAFLGVPLAEGGKAIGLVGVGNREGGYTDEHRQALEMLAPTIVQVLLRKRAEDALRESEEKYRSVVENASDGIIIVQDNTVKYANRRLAELDGSTVELLVGSQATDHVMPSDIERLTGMYRRRIAGEKVSLSYEAVLRRRDGRPVDAELNIGVITYQGKPAVLAVIRDITERKIVEKALRDARDGMERCVAERTEQLRVQTQLMESERNRLITLLNSMSDGVWMADLQGNILLMNRVAREMTVQVGLDPDRPYAPEILSQVEVFTLDGHPLSLDTFVDVIQGNPIREMEIGVRNRKSGDVFYRRLSVNAIRDSEQRAMAAVVVLQDITVQKRAEEEKTRLEKQLRQAQKMEAIGTLAGGIAHDFNNMLAVILGNAELALDDLDSKQEVEANIKQIINASKRARDLTKQILAFSRKTERARNTLKLTPLVKETFNMLRGAIPSTIRMEMNAEAEADAIMADSSQIQQVMVNLATNAAYAMRNKGGLLSVTLSDLTAAEEGQTSDIELRPGRYVKLSVQDSGTGMSEKVRNRVFEPFFTTKGRGKGTGMGLAVVYGIVKSHDGDITVESIPGEGSTFNVFLPLAKVEAAAEQEERSKVAGGDERILLVDDEPTVLQITSKILKGLVYRVTTGHNGMAAWEAFKDSPRKFDLVISDQVMPDLTGMRLAKKILKLRKDIPIILATGFSETVSAEEAKAHGISAYLMKPLTKQEVAETIRKVLDHKKQG